MLDLRISEICNFGCQHCIAVEAKKHGSIMRIEQAARIIDTYVNFLNKLSPNNRIIDVHFGIAEPLVAFEQLKQVILYIDDVYGHFQRYYSINTNLSLLTLSMAKFFQQHDVQIHASIDGLKESNDLIRTFKNGSGTFDSIIDSMRLLNSIGYPLHDIGVTITNKNYRKFIEQVDEFVGWCSDVMIKEVACEFDLTHLSISVDEKIAFLMSLIDKLEGVGIDLDGTWGIPYHNLVNATYANSAFAFCKGASGINLSVDLNGDVFLCSCSSKKICSIFSIPDEISPNGRFYKHVHSKLLGPRNECSGCCIEGCCVGQCSVTREYHPYMDKMVLEQCEFYRKITMALLERDAKLLVKGGGFDEGT